MTRPSTPFWLGAAILTLGLGAAAAFWLASPDGAQTQAAEQVAALPATPASMRPTVTPASPTSEARTLTFAVVWKASSTVRLGGSPQAPGSGALESSVDVAFELVLEGGAPSREATDYRVTARRFSSHRVTVLGEDALPGDAAVRTAFDGRTAVAAFSSEGTLVRVTFPAEAPPLFRHVLQSVLMEMSIARPGPEGRVASEPGPSGMATVTYRRRPSERDTIERVRSRYDVLAAVPAPLRDGAQQQLRSATTIRLRDDRVVEAIADRETLDVSSAEGAPIMHSEWQFDATLRSDVPSAPIPAVTPGPTTVWTPGQRDASPEAEAKLLDLQIAGLTATELLDQLQLYGGEGTGVNARGLVARASALLIRDPELCESLVQRFLAEGTSVATQSLILDVLAAAGHPAAQDAMVRALSREGLADEPTRYASLIQRFAFVTHPTAETVAFVADQARNVAAGDARKASLYALGSLLAGLHREGEKAAAEEYAAALRQDLAAAKATEDRITLLAALGNSALPGDAPAILSLAADADPSVRSAVAIALRSQPWSVSKDALLALVADPTSAVSRSAAQALGSQPVGSPAFAELARLVLFGATSPEIDEPLVNAFADRLETCAPCVQAVRFLFERNVERPGLQARIRQLLPSVATP